MRLFTWNKVQKATDEPNEIIGDDWYYLKNDGIEVPGIEDMNGNTERHIFTDSGRIVPKDSHTDRYLGQTLRRGQDHIHPDDDHSFHVKGTGDGYSNSDETLERFKKTTKEIRDDRKTRRA